MGIKPSVYSISIAGAIRPRKTPEAIELKLKQIIVSLIRSHLKTLFLNKEIFKPESIIREYSEIFIPVNPINSFIALRGIAPTEGLKEKTHMPRVKHTMHVGAIKSVKPTQKWCRSKNLTFLL